MGNFSTVSRREFFWNHPLPQVLKILLSPLLQQSLSRGMGRCDIDVPFKDKHSSVLTVCILPGVVSVIISVI